MRLVTVFDVVGLVTEFRPGKDASPFPVPPVQMSTPTVESTRPERDGPLGLLHDPPARVDGMRL